MTKDVTKAIEAKSDQLNADDLAYGPRVILITDVSVKGGVEQPIWVHYEGDGGKPWKPCKTASRCLAACYGVDANNWIGKHVEIYNDPTVTWAGMAVGGIRMSRAEGLAKPIKLALAKTRGKKGIVTIEPLVVEDVKKEPKKPAPTIDTDTLFQDARDNAELGRDAMREWWATKSKEEQAAMKSILPELQEIAAKADADDQ